MKTVTSEWLSHAWKDTVNEAKRLLGFAEETYKHAEIYLANAE